MQLSFGRFIAFLATAAVAVNAAAAAVPLPGTKPAIKAATNGDVVALDFNVGLMCSDPNLAGTCFFINVGAIPSGCRNFIGAADNVFTSLRSDSGIRCVFFTDTNCAGAAVTVTSNTAPNLSGTNFDNSISSVSCFAA